jgi:hypothetical protein
VLSQEIEPFLCPSPVAARDTPYLDELATELCALEWHVATGRSAATWLQDWSKPDRSAGKLLYFASGPFGSLKIGVSVGPLHRMTHLKYAKTTLLVAMNAPAGCSPLQPFCDLRVVMGCGGWAKENAMHRMLAHERISREWFRGPDSSRLLDLAVARAVPYGSPEEA